MGRQGLVELVGDGIGEAALADTYQRLLIMGLGPEVGDLGTSEHRDSEAAVSQNGGATVAHQQHEALAAIKRELGALVLAGVLVLWAAASWFEGGRELAIIAGYGLGAALWVHARARGLLYAARQRGRREGAEQDADGP